MYSQATLVVGIFSEFCYREVISKINMQAVHVFCSVQPNVLAASSINEKSANLAAVSLLSKSVA